MLPSYNIAPTGPQDKIARKYAFKVSTKNRHKMTVNKKQKRKDIAGIELESF